MAFCIAFGDSESEKGAGSMPDLKTKSNLALLNTLFPLDCRDVFSGSYLQEYQCLIERTYPAYSKNIRACLIGYTAATFTITMLRKSRP